MVLATVGMMGRRARRHDPEGVDAERSSRDWGQIWERFTVAALQRAAEHLPVVVPFLRGSARSEAGGPTAGGFDLSVFGTGLLLIALVAFSLWWGSRTTNLEAKTPHRR
ncbi:hypothetical protein EAH80_26220 [Mycobacterium hodleri]|uniref:Uncharacterized protein n=1 Tax=Mycolicibacterium hodleri TaxID=49897 RepID=A0A502DW38_9MYCO|nr:hypothetical protein EAH80_26220 [Mycolicibacterium hodleri]